jgi:hypothetical protein
MGRALLRFIERQPAKSEHQCPVRPAALYILSPGLSRAVLRKPSKKVAEHMRAAPGKSRLALKGVIKLH